MSISESVTIYTDGGARGNPGPAAIGGVIIKDGKMVEEFSHYIGEKTNNQAEYAALLAGLELATKHTDVDVKAILDSELVVKQLQGEYKVKSPELRKLVPQVRHLEDKFKSVTYEHTRREQNVRADELVNEALDTEEEKSSS
ncbi:ribonuclease HI family protein [Patescibacteria group bacterium]|nr:ribonuclease HI family protein [Patescibacteria group bacterium]